MTVEKKRISSKDLSQTLGAEEESDDEGGEGSGGSTLLPLKRRVIVEDSKASQRWQQKPTALPPLVDEEEEGGEGGEGLPEISLYEIFERIRQQHKEGILDPSRPYSEPSALSPEAQQQIQRDQHPLSKSAYFSGQDPRETSLPSDSSEPGAQQKLELKLQQQLRKQLGLTMDTAPKPSPYN